LIEFEKSYEQKKLMAVKNLDQIYVLALKSNIFSGIFPTTNTFSESL
jgi:hypothetical protein